MVVNTQIVWYNIIVCKKHVRHNKEVKLCKVQKVSGKEFRPGHNLWLIKEQAPRLVGVLQTKYCYEKDKKPVEMLDDYEKLTRIEKIELLGWIVSASNRLINDMALGAISYITLSTMRRIDKMVEKELNDANQEEWKFFEKGYKLALKNKK